MRFYLALCTLFWQPVNYNFTTGESGEEVSSFLNFTSFFFTKEHDNRTWK
jgi:hypothetical protein